MAILCSYNQTTIDVTLMSALDAAREHKHEGVVVCANPRRAMELFCEFARGDVSRVEMAQMWVEMISEARVFFIRTGEEDRMLGHNLEWVWSDVDELPTRLHERLVPATS